MKESNFGGAIKQAVLQTASRSGRFVCFLFCVLEHFEDGVFKISSAS